MHRGSETGETIKLELESHQLELLDFSKLAARRNPAARQRKTIKFCHS